MSLRMEIKMMKASSQLNLGESESVSRSVVSDPLRHCELQPARLLCPWNSPGKKTGVGSHSLLQGIFLTLGLNPGFLHCRWILCHLSHQGDLLLLFHMCKKRIRGLSNHKMYLSRFHFKTVMAEQFQNSTWFTDLILLLPDKKNFNSGLSLQRQGFQK